MVSFTYTRTCILVYLRACVFAPLILAQGAHRCIAQSKSCCLSSSLRGLEDILHGLKLRYTGKLEASERETFFRQLFSFPEVLSCIEGSTGPLQSVKAQQLTCTALSMSFFDCLTGGEFLQRAL
jgi:hypothetical protein